MGRWLWKSFFCFFILTCITGAQKILLERSRASILDEKTCETAAFREQHLPTELYRQLRNQDESSGNTDWIENLTTTMLNGKFYPGRCSSDREPYLRYKYKEYTDFNEETIADADILYMTRVQRERFTDLMEYERVKDVYILRNKMLEHTRPNLRILHPLPRVNEIAYDVDENPKAYYFQQAQNGLYARQAILCDVLGITLNDVIEDAKK